MCAVVKQVSLRPAELGCTVPLDWCVGHQQNFGANSTFTLPAQQRHVSLRHWKEQLPIVDCAPSQRRDGFKAGQISLHLVYHLVPCSPIFQSLCPTNRLCSPPSGSCLCTCIAPQAKIHRLYKPQDSPRSVPLRCSLPNNYSLFFVSLR